MQLSTSRLLFRPAAGTSRAAGDLPLVGVAWDSFRSQIEEVESIRFLNVLHVLVMQR
jgi:hypothetical protein